jgi:hypothetical protein
MYRQKVLSRTVRRCKHIKTNGIQCGSPALREHDCCYFHRQARRDFPRRKAVKDVPETVIDLALIDDPDGIHYALMQVIQGVLNGTLNHKSAGLTIQALQIMSSNFKRTSFQRQLEMEFNNSELNAYEIWEQMEKEDQEKAAKQLHQKRIEELKRLERTCCKCRKETVEVATETPSATTEISACEESQQSRESGDRVVGSSGDRKAKALNPKDAKDAKKRPTSASRTWGTGGDHHIGRSSDHRIPSTLERTLCDLDSLPSSDVPMRASPRC